MATNKEFDQDILLNKMAIIEKCIERIREVYDQQPENLKDFTLQDSIVLNIQRAAEASIDLAMHLVSSMKLGLPQHSRDAFQLLHEHDLIDEVLYERMTNMVGFRNIAVHDYQKINLVILQKIVDQHLTDFEDFTASVKRIFERS